MRRLPLLLALLVVFASAATAQTAEWSLLAASPLHPYRFEDASFLDPQRGWIVNGDGETWRTLDGGASWTRRSVVGDYLRAAAFVSPTKGWIGALYGPRKLYETTDGGATLTNVTGRIAPAIGGGICGLWAVNAQVAYGVGQWSGPAYVIKTTDGGATWQSRNLSAQAGSLIDVHFFDANRGIAVGGTNATSPGSRALVLGTEDGGVTWTERFRSTTSGSSRAEWAWKVTFPSPLVGYVSVEQDYSSTAKVLKTTDGGQTWTQLAAPGGGSLQGVGFITPLRGWISGRGTVSTTTDGGATWSPTSALDGQVNRFRFFGDTLGYAMGRRIFRLVGSSGTAAEDEPGFATTGLLGISPNPSAGRVSILLQLTRPGPATVAVYDVLGRRVAVLADGTLPAGERMLDWDGRDASGARVPPGVYFVRLDADGRRHTRAVTVLR